MKEKIKQILSMYEQGMTLSEIHEKLGISVTEFSKLLKAI